MNTSPVWTPRLTDVEREFLVLADRLTRDRFAPAAAAWDETGAYAAANVETLFESGLATMFVGPEFGGAGSSVTATTAVLERIAQDCASTATILSTLLLGVYPIAIHGTAEQRAWILERFVNERAAVSFALTEREAGSDLRSLTTTARLVDGRYVLDGEKWLIGNGGQASTYVVFARTESGAGLSAFLVPAESPGLSVDHVHRKMGLRGTATSNLRLDAVVVEPHQMVGAEGRGARVALAGLDLGRVAVAATATGLGIGAFEVAAHRASERMAFGHPVIENQAIGFRLADVATELTTARLLTYAAAAAADREEPITTIASMAKLHASEVSHRAVDTAVQVFGGIGYTADAPADRMYRDQRGYELAEGTSEIQRLVISRAILGWLGSSAA